MAQFVVLAVIAEAIVSLLVIAALGIGAFIFTIRNLIYICGPDEVLIFSGSKRRTIDRVLGYRIIKGGRGVRIPLLETVDRLALTNMNIDVQVQGAYSKGGIPLNVQAVANVKVAGDEPIIHNAIERLLPKSRDEIMRIAKETLEGNLRGVLATLTPEEVNEDKIKFAESLTVEAGEDLSGIGLYLDSLKIQNVTDDQGYLQAIGRQQSAELESRAVIAEAQAKAEAVIRDAENFERTRLRQVEEELKVVRSQAERRIIDAETKREALVREQQSEVEAMIARAEAEVLVESARIDMIEKQIRAETIEPAIAHRDAAIYDARGATAKIVADGEAHAEAIRKIAEVWSEAGESGKSVLLLQRLGQITTLLTSTMPKLQVTNMTMIDMSDSKDASMPVRAISAMEQIKHATGVDVASVAQRVLAPKS